MGATTFIGEVRSPYWKMRIGGIIRREATLPSKGGQTERLPPTKRGSGEIDLVELRYLKVLILFRGGNSQLRSRHHYGLGGGRLALQPPRLTHYARRRIVHTLAAPHGGGRTQTGWSREDRSGSWRVGEREGLGGERRGERDGERERVWKREAGWRLSREERRWYGVELKIGVRSEMGFATGDSRAVGQHGTRPDIGTDGSGLSVRPTG
ncbi:hypothetical protein GWI33_016454 [Rhynchophorus ferrugineus]|uniref:Uncharacterized protein n=1 Tax=Rhynchophorus ferrugineus TaxID=354439 RepID=A0A834M3B6_RHYFE|nr:hypothetical protein GWI33_016454 [Rhynchophorus ferrugineus]